jgi:hypothetical protein
MRDSSALPAAMKSPSQAWKCRPGLSHWFTGVASLATSLFQINYNLASQGLRLFDSATSVGRC